MDPSEGFQALLKALLKELWWQAVRQKHQYPECNVAEEHQHRER